MSLEQSFNPPVYPIKVSYRYTFLFCIIYFFPLSLENQGSAVLVPLHIANECISMQILKKERLRI